MDRVTLHIPAINCGGCVQSIRSGLSKQPGIGEIEADIPTKRVTIAYDPAAIDIQQIRAALEKLKFPAAA
jgi:copper chaperone CopZ